MAIQRKGPDQLASPGAQPFKKKEECKHPLTQLRTAVQEQLRGQASKVKFTCRQCDVTWNGSDAVLPVLHYAYQNEVRRLERMIIRLGGRPE